MGALRGEKAFARCARGGRECKWRERYENTQKKRSYEIALYVQQLQVVWFAGNTGLVQRHVQVKTEEAHVG